jgi:Protein of unknown function (DUF3606)
MQSEQNNHQFESSKIHLNESWELNHWCEVFNLRAEELKEIVKRVGPNVEAVRDYLARQNMRNEKSF